MELLFDSKLGQGAFGDVWLAVDNLSRKVAVKFFNDPQPSLATKNALDHARALAKVNHPSVVRVLSVETQPHPESDAPGLAIIMEYVEGTNLSLHSGSFNQIEATAIVQNVTDALQAIHSAGLVHGDLHDGNVLLHSSGAKLADILYTHSLADVGSKTAMRTRKDDLRSLAVLLRAVLAKAPCDPRLLEDAFYRATTASETPAEVRAAFSGVLHSGRATGASPERPRKTGKTSAHGQQGSSAKSGTKSDQTLPILELVQKLQSKTAAVSSCIAEALSIAIKLGDRELKAFCERELVGIPSQSDSISRLSAKETRDIKHRLISFHVSLGEELNLEFFGSGRAAIEYLQSQPNKHPEVKLIYPEPITKIEHQASGASPEKLTSMRMPATALVPDSKISAPLFLYASGDALRDVVEAVRGILTAKLLPHLGDVDRSPESP